MAADISPDVSNHIMAQRVMRGEEISTTQGQGLAFVMEMSRQAFLNERREVGVVEGRAVSGVLATPIASPATQTGG